MLEPTLIGHVESVKGGSVAIRLREEVPTVLMVQGRSYRIGQVGAFLRIPLGYSQLYAVCTLVGAAAAPLREESPNPVGARWLEATLFGESIGGFFERGVSQYPTIEDEVHLVTPEDMRVVYGSMSEDRAIRVGRIAAASGISGDLDLGRLVVRHSAVVGSTGSGKSNLVAVLLEAIATQGFDAARVLVVDPHGEYASAVGQHARVFRINPDEAKGERHLYVPFWALPFDEWQELSLGKVQPQSETAIRDLVTAQKLRSSRQLDRPPPEAAITSDSPIPFSMHRLWFELDDFERRTYEDRDLTQPATRTQEGDATALVPNQYPPPSPGTTPPFAGRPRHISRQLEQMRSRLRDARYAFLFQPGEGLAPSLDGEVEQDLDELVSSWVGHDRPITVLDVSGMPSDLLSAVVGTVVRLVYDMLFWAGDSPVGGRNQPLLIALEEAHLFLPADGESPAHRAITKIAKEGRKYGIGLCVVTQRPSEIDATVLSQCGTMVALRLANASDRSKVEAAMPDDLGALSAMLPSLRTGEALVLGEAMPIPSRIQFYKARKRPRGDDPEMPQVWRSERPDADHYETALLNWRRQSHHERKEPEDG